jgi:putative endonuclease
MPVRRLGADAEDRVADELLTRGWTVVTRRWKGRAGELDIVALDGETLVIVEVKSRKLGGLPEESITKSKVARLRQTASEYLHATGLEPEAMRYDIALIEGGELRFVENAFVFDVAVAVPDVESDVY